MSIKYSEYSLIRCNEFVFKEYGGLMRLVDQLGIHWYLYIILAPRNCGGLKGLVDKAVTD